MINIPFVRLPAVWDVELDVDYYDDWDAYMDAMNLAIKELQKNVRLVPGDIIVSNDPGSDCNGVMMVDLEGDFDQVIVNGDAEGFIPPWVSEFYMSFGYSFEDICKIYDSSPCRYVLYPRDMQGDNLVVVNGDVVELLGWDHETGETDAEEMEWHFVSGFNITEKALFL